MNLQVGVVGVHGRFVINTPGHFVTEKQQEQEHATTLLLVRGVLIVLVDPARQETV